jgi:hypothetical protein
MRPKLSFRNQRSGTVVDSEVLMRFAIDIGLEAAARGRYSLLLPYQIMQYEEAFGVAPSDIIYEIKALESVGGSRTKPAAPFNGGGSLGGLYHKHFTTSSVSMVSRNVLLANGRRSMRRLADEHFADGLSSDAIAEFVNALVVSGYERRAESSTLTGEWIIFAEHDGRRHYLCLATHEGGDDEVLGYIRNVCSLEFPFLRKEHPHLFDNGLMGQKS